MKTHSITFQSAFEVMGTKDHQQVVDSLFCNGIQISSFIFEKLTPITPLGIDDLSLQIFTTQLKSLSKILNFLDRLGWVEHTSDWDPYLIIKLKNGAKIETQCDFWQFEIIRQDTTIRIEDDEETHTFRIKDVISIEVTK